jgi:hypothetical protein
MAQSTVNYAVIFERMESGKSAYGLALYCWPPRWLTV